MADIEKVRRNIKRMIDQGAPEADIDTYLNSEGVTLEQVKSAAAPPIPQPRPGPRTTSPSIQERAGVFGRGMDLANDLVRSAADVITFGTADETQAWLNTKLGLGKHETYEKNLAHQRALDKAIPPEVAVPGAIGGVLLSGGMAGPRIVAQSPTIAKQALRAAGAGGLFGGAYGFGSGESAKDRLKSAATGGTVGAVTGGTVGGIAGKIAQRTARKTIPTTEKLRKAAAKAYDTADRSGVVISGQSFRGVVEKIQQKMAQEGMDATLHPRATAAMKRLMDASGDNVTLKGAEVLRRVIQNAASSADPSERRLAAKMLNRLDDYIENIGRKDVIGKSPEKATKALKEARSLWSRYRKAEFVEGLIERAKTRASQFSGSGYENALRTEFRRVAQNAKEMRRFSPREQAAIKRVAKGGKIGNLLRMIGKFAPTGVVSSALSGGAGYAAGGPLGAVGLPTAGFAARGAATALTGKSARIAADLARSGGSLPKPRLTPGDIRGLGQATVGGAIGSQKAIEEMPPWLRRILGY